MAGAPSELVLDRFAVTHVERTLPGGQGRSVLAGDLALSPDRDPGTQGWLSPIQARLAYELDTEPGRRPLRLAMPVPARDGEWVVQGWGATRFEPHASPCDDLALMRAAGHLLHARLAVAVPEQAGGTPHGSRHEGGQPMGPGRGTGVRRSGRAAGARGVAA